MSARQRALAYLTHPSVVVSIVLLILNDTLWKGSGPGWMTGKLSDFAGLVFFPGLLALVLALAVPRISGSPIGRIAWWSTAAFFAAVKSIPFANTAFADAIAGVRGPVQVVLDPTDVLALTVLPGGWWLWNRVSAPSRPTTLRTSVSWAVATTAVLATGATQPRDESNVQRDSVSSFAAPDNQTRIYAIGPGTLAVSSDHGATWKESTEFADSAPPADTGSANEMCHPVRREVCYRIDKRFAVHESGDGGRTWRVSWDRSTAEHSAADARVLPYAEAQSLFVAGQPEPTVLVALGVHGILRREHGGTWKRVQVLDVGAPPKKGIAEKVVGFGSEVSSLLVLIAGMFAIAVGVPVLLLTWRLSRNRARARDSIADDRDEFFEEVGDA